METTTQTDSGGVTGDLTGIEFRIPLEGMFTEETFRKEMNGIFKKSWLPAGHTFDIPNPGDYRARHLPGINQSILIVRGRDNVIRAFHNACRHRGAMLTCPNGSGNSRQGLACPYHGWTYNLDGSVRGITDSDQFPQLDKSTLGLAEIRCEVRHSFVFINFDNEAESLDEWLEFFAEPELFEGYFERARPGEFTSAKVRVNWNLCVDAFSEGYHTLFVHKNTGGDYLGGDENPMRHNPALQVGKLHSRLASPANPNHKWTPTEKLAYSFAVRCHPSFDSDCSGLPPGVNYSKLGPWAFDVVRLFPNMILLLGRDWFVEFHFWPVSPTETLAEWNLFLCPPKNYGERIGQEFSYAFTKEISLEDLFLLEDQQRALESDGVKEYFLSYQELMLAHHYRNRARMLAGQ